MIRPRRQIHRTRPVLVHLTTADISLALLLGDQLVAFQQAGFEVIGISAPGDFVPVIEAMGITHIPLKSATRSMSVLSDLRAARELWKIVRRLRPDIVHTHNPKPGIYGRVVAALTGVPVVINTVHGIYATEDDSFLRRVAVYGLERLAASFSDAELVQNPEDVRVLRRLRVPERRLYLLGNGIDLDRFSAEGVTSEDRRRARAALGAMDDSVVVLAVGRLVWEKGYRELFSAAAAVRRSHPQAIFLVAGPTEPAKTDGIRPADIASAEEAGIRFLGHRDDVELLYAAADIYVLASHREGFPRSAMEAAAMGIPVVATDIRGCRQVVEDGVTGLLVPVKDPSALAAAISTLVGDGPARRRMGAAALVKAKREFDRAAVIDTTVAAYRRGLSVTRAGRGTPSVSEIADPTTDTSFDDAQAEAEQEDHPSQIRLRSDG